MDIDARTLALTDSLCDVMLGEKLPFSFTFQGAEFVPAERKLTRSILLQLAVHLREDPDAVAMVEPASGLRDPGLAYAANGKRYTCEILLSKIRDWARVSNFNWNDFPGGSVQEILGMRHPGAGS